MKKNLFSLLLCFLSLSFFVGCQKEEGFVAQAPGILNFGVEEAEKNIALSETVEFKPELLNEPTKCEWRVNGELVSTQSSFSFAPKKAGRYAIVLFVENEVGSASKQVDIIVRSRPGGFYIVNEGRFGVDPGSLSFFDSKKEAVETTVFATENPEKRLGTTTCFGTIWGDDFYLVSKQGAQLVVADAYSLAHKKTIDYIKGDGRAFAGIDAKNGIFTTSNGVFLVDLEHLCVIKELESDRKECGDIVLTDKYIFVASSSSGVLVYDKSNHTLVKKMEEMLPGDYNGRVAGVVKTKDGNVWVGAKDGFFKINPEKLTAESVVHTNLKVGTSWGYWHSASMEASSVDNAIYYTFASGWTSRDVYRYKVGDLSSVAAPFAVSSDVTDAFYGKGFEEDPETGELVVTYVQDGWGDAYKENRIVFFDGKTGAEKKRYTADQLGESFRYFWFPTMIVFNN